MVVHAYNPSYSGAEVGELPEPRRQRLRWAKITPLHSSLGNKSETPSQKKKEYNSIQYKLLSKLFKDITWGHEANVLRLLTSSYSQSHNSLTGSCICQIVSKEKSWFGIWLIIFILIFPSSCHNGQSLLTLLPLAFCGEKMPTQVCIMNVELR